MKWDIRLAYQSNINLSTKWRLLSYQVSVSLKLCKFWHYRSMKLLWGSRISGFLAEPNFLRPLDSARQTRSQNAGHIEGHGFRIRSI